MTCTIVLVIILATLLLGITATLVATRYCKFKSGLVVCCTRSGTIMGENSSHSTTRAATTPLSLVPLWCTLGLVHHCHHCPPATPPTTPVIPPLNTQKLDRPSGPWHPLQRRNPPRIVQSASKLPICCDFQQDGLEGDAGCYQCLCPDRNQSLFLWRFQAQERYLQSRHQKIN